MKLVCESCGAENLATGVRVEGSRVLMTCGACGVESALLSAAPEGERAPADDATLPPLEAVPETSPAAQASEVEAHDEADATPGASPSELSVKCPRCFHRQSEPDHCHRCGLDLGRVERSTADWDAVAPDAQEAHARAAEMWAILLRHPDDHARHDVFVAHCTENRLLTYAVRRYREYLADHPKSAAMMAHRDAAARKLEAVALTLLASERWSHDVARHTLLARRVLLIVAALLLVGGMVLLVIVFKRTGTLAPPSF